MVKKLIEVALPLEKINAEAAREKSIRHGHPSTLHLWWARRPLAAARAVIWSSLVDDPSSHPEEFPTEEEQNKERQRLFHILENLVEWENSNNEEVLNAAKAEIMKSTGGNPPALLDPFAGGGAIPLEAQRLGLEAHAHDLNPVAVMINKAMIEIPPRFSGMSPVNPEDQKSLGGNTGWKGAAGLAADVRYYRRQTNISVVQCRSTFRTETRSKHSCRTFRQRKLNINKQPSFGTASLFYGGLKMEENKLYCSHCGALIREDEDYEEVNGEVVCSDCYERHTTTCDRCGNTIWTDDSYGDEYTNLCNHCYNNYYTRCSCCDALLHEDDVYHLDGYDYCSECYHDEVDRNRSIHDYGYKPEPIFYGDSKRYFGVELEIDQAGKDSDNADELLTIGNRDADCIYIKGDGSLDDGMEIVSHPMSLEYHKEFQWDEIMKKAIYLGYRSHQTSTCGLHIHVNRNCLGESREEQDEVISRILYFVEHHWNELLKFSRRSEYAMNRWASRYGYESSARAILDKAKKGNNGRYAAVNLMNYSTIEFRMFRGTLKLNTFMATLELVNAIIDVALDHSEEGLHKLSWSEFVSSITEPELIAYLKERRLYINESTETEEDL